MSKRSNESVIILAAGSSSRLGQSKQLVEVGGRTLLHKSVQSALEANYSNVLVVLGANANVHKKAIENLPVEILVHGDWERGMGSSLKAGLQHILSLQPETTAIIVMVCDQPMISSAHLRLLDETYQITGKQIIASHYANTTGVPALFDRSIFPELLKINDNQGAKVVIEKNQSKVITLDWQEGSIDIDTPEDLKRLRS